MNVWVIGKNGQLATALHTNAPGHVSLTCSGSTDIDIGDASSLEEAAHKIKPQWVINTAAYTAVDKAENESDQANHVNHIGAEAIAQAAQAAKASLIHISTDFVFDGSQGHPYRPMDKANPLSVYGKTKYLGEQAVLKAAPNSTIIRTSWVFSPYGNNFVKTMLRLMHERESLQVVTDQVGSPSSADELAQFIWQLTRTGQKLPPIMHWTNCGVCSWYDFAIAIDFLGRKHNLLSRPTNITPIPAAQYPTPAARPQYSVLDKEITWQLSSPATHWFCALEDTIKHLAKEA